MPDSGPIPSQLVKESRTEATAGSQTSHRTMRLGTTTIRETTILSRPESWSMPLYVRLLAMAALPPGQEPKMLFFWDSILLQRPSMSVGFLMKSWMAGIITVDAKSGRVSRSMNWVIDLADLTSSSD